MKKSKFISALLFFTFLNLVFAQPESNLTIIYNLIEKNVDQLLRKLPHETDSFIFDYSSPEVYSSLKNRYINKLKETGFLASDSERTYLSYSLDNIRIQYSEPERDGLLGDYKLVRNLSLTGTYVYKTNGVLNSTEIIETTYSDTLDYADLNRVENSQIDFTSGTKPSEPVFESLLEPVIAVGAVIVTIILLFTVRSK